MEWNVYWFDPNQKEIIVRNVFKLSVKFNEELDRLRENHVKDFSTFSEELRHAAMYCYWSKCEHEICVCDWMEQEYGMKIDVYDQLRLNWDAFSAYTWARLYREAE